MESASISIYNQKGGVDCRLPSREYVSGHGMELLGLVMRVVKPGRRRPPFPTSKTPGMEIRKARPSGDSHGLADFHLRRLIPCRRENSHRKLPCYRRSKIGNRISCKIAGHY